MRFVCISEQTAIISLYNINWLVCITDAESVYCAVRTGCSTMMQSVLAHHHSWQLQQPSQSSATKCTHNAVSVENANLKKNACSNCRWPYDLQLPDVLYFPHSFIKHSENVQDRHSVRVCTSDTSRRIFVSATRFVSQFATRAVPKGLIFNLTNQTKIWWMLKCAWQERQNGWTAERQKGWKHLRYNL